MRRYGGFKDLMTFEHFLVASKAHGGFHQIERSLLCRFGQVTASGGLIASSYGHLKFRKIIPANPGQNLDKTDFRAKLAPEPYQYTTGTSLGYSPDTPNSISGPFRNHPGVKSFRAPKPIK